MLKTVLIRLRRVGTLFPSSFSPTRFYRVGFNEANGEFVDFLFRPCKGESVVKSHCMLSLITCRTSRAAAPVLEYTTISSIHHSY